MIETFPAQLATLPDSQRDIYPRLAGAKELGFALYGGTALALRLAHRQSVDFDFFTERNLDKREMQRRIPPLRDALVLQSTHNTLTVAAGAPGSPVKLSFFGGLSFGRVGDPAVTEDGVLQVASFDDLFATKLKAMFDRVEARDYLDVIALLKAGRELAVGLGAARGLFGKAFQPAEALKLLVYFEGGDLAVLTKTQRTFLESKVAYVGALPIIEVKRHELALV